MTRGTVSVETEPVVAPADLRAAMRRFATGVTVVATDDGEATYAAVVNSFTSVSLEPPLVLVCLKVGSRTCDAIRRRGAFSICVLADDHRQHSQRLAKSQPTVDDEAFTVVDGLPVIRDTLAGLLCEVESAQVKGDHVIVIGEVVRTHAAQREPLLFYDGRYHVLTGQAEADPAAVTDRK
ncbi:flavin reductase family protein [Streptomyces sp. NPDC058045]|uniref:flavin reductase family protein n=1 Tax=Streptomyces sp. NPDC058045 TaxID=3346311 RepID=UPI0036E75571